MFKIYSGISAHMIFGNVIFAQYAFLLPINYAFHRLNIIVIILEKHLQLSSVLEYTLGFVLQP